MTAGASREVAGEGSGASSAPAAATAVDVPAPLPHGGIHRYVQRWVDSLGDLTGRVVLDIPCGDGRTSRAFHERGATVKAFDLFPEFMQVPGLQADFADLSERLPLDDASVDYVVCQEGIEHISDKIGMFREFNRVLKPGGRLVFTLPSISHVRARLSWFLVESDLWKRPAPSELDSVWFTEDGSDRLYFGHLFLIGVHHLLTICHVTGFRVRERRATKLSGSSLVLGLLAWPLLALASVVAHFSYRRKLGHVEPGERDRILGERLRLNLSPTTLFRRHLFWVCEKECELDAAVARLKALTRGV